MARAKKKTTQPVKKTAADKPAAKKKTTTPRPKKQAAGLTGPGKPVRVTVEVARHYAGGPDIGTRLTIVATDYVRNLIRNGFLKAVE